MATKDTVERLITRKTPTGKKAYTIKFANEGFVGAGFNSPDCDEGDTVVFEWHQNAKGYKQLTEGSLKVVDGGAAQSSSQAPEVGGKSKGDYWDAKEARDLKTQAAIQYQASRNAAIQVASTALQYDCLSLGAKKADRIDILLAFIDELTDRYNQDVSDVMSSGKRSGSYDSYEPADELEQVSDDFE